MSLTVVSGEYTIFRPGTKYLATGCSFGSVVTWNREGEVRTEVLTPAGIHRYAIKPADPMATARELSARITDLVPADGFSVARSEWTETHVNASKAICDLVESYGAERID